MTFRHTAPPEVSVCAKVGSTGMKGFTDLTNTLAGWTLLVALFGAVIGLIVMAIGPALGIQSARRYGTLILLTALAAAIGLGVIAGLINGVYALFGSGC